MGRYFFHVTDGQTYPDRQGAELAGLDEVRAEALLLANTLLTTIRGDFWGNEDWTMRVTDSRDLTLFTLTFMATNAAATSGR